MNTNGVTYVTHSFQLKRVRWLTALLHFVNVELWDDWAQLGENIVMKKGCYDRIFHKSPLMERYPNRHLRLSWIPISLPRKWPYPIYLGEDI
jgi:hypothetical protein